MEIVSGFKARLRGKKILIIGDIMLDSYLFGKVNRISPEAPVSLSKGSTKNGDKAAIIIPMMIEIKNEFRATLWYLSLFSSPKAIELRALVPFPIPELIEIIKKKIGKEIVNPAKASVLNFPA